MSSMPVRAPLAALVVCLVTLKTAPAQATAEPPKEPGRVAAELALGLGIAGAGTGLLFALDGAGGVLGLVVLATPVATGVGVCVVGSNSDLFDGSCGASIGGALLGALLVLPGALLGTVFAPQGIDEQPYGLLVGGAVGFGLGSAAGAVVGWNLSRRPKGSAPPPTAHIADWREPPRARGPEPGARAGLLLPLLSFRF